MAMLACSVKYGERITDVDAIGVQLDPYAQYLNCKILHEGRFRSLYLTLS